MEKHLNIALNEIMNTECVQGVVVSDRHGLCLGAKGAGAEQSSGIWTALLKEAGKLEPELGNPTLVLESQQKQYLVQGNEKLILSIYRDRV